MSFQDHLKTCSYCRKDSQKVTVSIKSASSYYREKKLAGSCIIKGASYPPISIPVFRTKGASARKNIARPGPIEREVKLKALGWMVRG